jgi:HD-like signal output (HDOD) protein
MNENILKNIKFLPTLPQSVANVNRICMDKESSLSDLAEEIKKDPVASGTLLKIANSSLYGSRNIRTVEMAVGMFGKAVTKSYVLSSAISNLVKLDFSAYGISPDDYSLISQKRTAMMYEWYNDIDSSMIDTLTTATQLSSLGQILISQDIVSAGKTEEFLEEVEAEEDIDLIELNLSKITTLEVTAEILKHWKLADELIETIIYSTSLEKIQDAPDHIKPYAIANFAIYQTIDLVGNIEIKEDILELLSDNGLDEDKFVSVVENIRDIQD